MSAHQIIYTSCMRGIKGVNDGQQIYSYDVAFQDANQDEVKNLFTYQPPTLDAGVVMTEEIADMMPQAFIYRRLDDGSCAMALNTYLGRDYMGSAGRFGNHLSHVVVFDASDTKCYPIEYYGSDMFRNRMKFEEVNNPEQPPYLPTPELVRGYRIDLDAVLDFLGQEDRLETYKNMVCAMLRFEHERKRVVICDQPENIVLWIAALSYVLPLQNALQMNFSTYDYDPALSFSQVCGVVPNGTRFTYESYRQHFVFNLLEGNIPELEKDAEFFDFIDMAMSLSYESLQVFHTFLAKGYTYVGIDESLYDAYALYSLLSDGLRSTSPEKIQRAISFTQQYALPQEALRTAQAFLREHRELLRIDTGSYLAIFGFIMTYAPQFDPQMLRQMKNSMVDRVLREFLSERAAEDSFETFYQRLNDLCAEHGLSIATELMAPDNQTKLFAVMEQDLATWKLTFIVQVVSGHIKDARIPVEQLLLDAPLGQLFHGIVNSVYAGNRALVVQRVLGEFAEDCNFLSNMGLNLEGMLLDIPDGAQEVERMWEHYGQLIMSKHGSRLDAAYDVFFEVQRYDLVYMLYSRSMSQAASPEACRSLFEEHDRRYVQRVDGYAKQYGEKLLSTYFQRLCPFSSEATYFAKTELLYLLLERKLPVDFANHLIHDLVKPIPLSGPVKGEEKLVRDMFQYSYNINQQPLQGKLLLLVLGIVLEEVEDRKDLHSRLDLLAEIMRGGKAKLPRTAMRNAEGYFGWFLPNICQVCDRGEDFGAVYSLFDMSSEVEASFFGESARLYLKRGKEEKGYNAFCAFLEVVFDNAGSRSCEEISTALCKLSKQKLEVLDETVKACYSRDSKACGRWDSIREKAESTNPLLNNISNLFKRRKD